MLVEQTRWFHAATLERARYISDYLLVERDVPFKGKTVFKGSSDLSASDAPGKFGRTKVLVLA
jgi:hypothetical protein